MTDPAPFAALRHRHRLDDNAALQDLLPAGHLTDAERHAAERQARQWIENVRNTRVTLGGVADFLQEFRLSSLEGVALMCVAEALLRVPDAATADDLIRDRLGAVDWDAHEKRTGTLFANASVWGLMLTGSLLKPHETGGLGGITRALLGRVGQPVLRATVTHAMGLLGNQFVLGRTIGEALERAAESERRGYRFSYDMLGEGARTADDAARYLKAYEEAIDAIGAAQESAAGSVWQAPGLSVKLSALHPRFGEAQRAHCLPVLVERLSHLAGAAARAGISLTVDAEESERLELTLEIVATVLQQPVCATWEGLGLAVQAYQKRAPAVIDDLADHCRAHHRRMMVRLVKGAYWDSEIKRAQMNGLADYPVYTRKVATDVSYLACARQLLARQDVIYPAFGSHNAFTLASLLSLAQPGQVFEFQRLQGMGRELHDQLVEAGHASRIYAPVGGHKELLAYLVRRILENGANSSFVHRVRDRDIPVAALVHDPAMELAAIAPKRNPSIPLPPDLFAPDRQNSAGVDLDAQAVLAPFLTAVRESPTHHTAGPILGGRLQEGEAVQQRLSPADQRQLVGTSSGATPAQVEEALTLAVEAQPKWAGRPVSERAACLDRAADLMETHRAELVALLGREAGRTLRNAVGEVREAVDLCRYYAMAARQELARPLTLRGYTGEINELTLAPRGIVAAISPWNFPLAIFVGQIAAALVTGNAVMAKPAEQTPLIAARAVQILHQAGIPGDVLALLPGPGETVGARLVQDPRVRAVAFTGSTEVGRLINQTLANRPGPIVPLVAETGGLNAMIVDSTALPEQVTDDVLASAFDSAGQRCSSLRVLFVQEDVADRMIGMITGALDQIRLGDPLSPATDMGPLIDTDAQKALEAHVARMKTEGERLYAGHLPESCAYGHFFPPHVFGLESLTPLTREAFGPVLHVVRWQQGHVGKIVAALRASGYGLTAGIHSRRAGFVAELAAALPVGNLYVNRNMIGAVPGVQPFGGEGLSGTGPKAGGPHMIRRFCTERCFTQDTTAAGGNTSLLMLDG